MEMDSVEEKIRKKITLMTFGCSLLVIWIHTYNLEMYGITSESVGFCGIVYAMENYWNRLTSIAVPLFFFISGFLFFRSYSLNSTVSKYKSRIKSVLIPYVCWCSIYYLYFVLITNIPAFKKVMNNATPTELSIINWLNWLGPNEYYTLWFLQNLLFFILGCPIFYILLKNRKVPLGTIVLVFLILNVYFKWVPSAGGLVEYAAGSWLAINYKEVVQCRNKYLTYAGWAYIILQAVIGFRWFGMIGQLIFFVAVWFALDSFKLEKTLPWWMQITFFTYVAHDILLEAIEKVMLVVFGRSPVWAIANYVFLPLFVFILLVVIAKIMKRFLPIVWNVVTGGR